MKAIAIGWGYGIWLCAIAVVFYLVRGNDIGALEYAVLAGVLPAALQLLLLGFETMGMARPVKLLLVFLLIVTIGYLVNGADWTALTYVIELIYITVIAAIVAAYPEALLFRRIAAVYCVLAAVFIVWIDFNGTYTWGHGVRAALAAPRRRLPGRGMVHLLRGVEPRQHAGAGVGNGRGCGFVGATPHPAEAPHAAWHGRRGPSVRPVVRPDDMGDGTALGRPGAGNQRPAPRP